MPFRRSSESQPSAASPDADSGDVTPKAEETAKVSRALRKARRKEARLEKKIAKQEAKGKKQALKDVQSAERKAAKLASSTAKDAPKAKQPASDKAEEGTTKEPAQDQSPKTAAALKPDGSAKPEQPTKATAKPTSVGIPADKAAGNGERSRSKSAATALALLAVGAGSALGISSLVSDEESPTAPAPLVIRDNSEAAAADELGFPGFATKNTTRIGGDDPIAVAAAASLAAYPAQGGVAGPPAVSLVQSGNWQAAVAASVFASADLGAPILIGETDSTPDFTSTALDALAPTGTRQTGATQVYAVGDVQVPEGLKSKELTGAKPAELAAAVDAERAELVKGKGNTDGAPEHILLVNGEQPQFSVAAASWAAFSGDPVLFVQENIVPPKTLEVLRRYKNVEAYLLGPESVASEKVFRKLRSETASIKRIAGETPVDNAIAFARFSDDSFGWGLIDPGHGFVISGVDQPVSAAAASILSRVGSPGPLLLTDQVDRLPGALDGFLLATKPGYIDDASRAQFNHAWIIGDETSIAIDQQAQIDERINLAEVSSGAGGPRLGASPEREATR